MIRTPISCNLLKVESQEYDEDSAPMLVDWYWISFPIMNVCLGPFRTEKEAITCLMKKLIKED